MTGLDSLGAATYVSLVTFKRDGTPVATPVWAARDGERLYVITPEQTGKVKRLRHTSRVLLAPCDVRGRLTGPQVEGLARLTDPEGTKHVMRLIDDKYGWLSTVLGRLDVAVRNRGKPRERVGIEIELASDA